MILKKNQYKKMTQKITFRNKIMNLNNIMKMPSKVSKGLFKL